MADRCKRCGACKECGHRPGEQTFIPYPYPVYPYVPTNPYPYPYTQPYRPYWSTIGTGAWDTSGGISVSSNTSAGTLQ